MRLARRHLEDHRRCRVRRPSSHHRLPLAGGEAYARFRGALAVVNRAAGPRRVRWTNVRLCMRRFNANARMYAVTPDVEGAWRGLLAHVTAEAEVELAYMPYPAPQPLDALWARPDLGCVFMCGYPIALKLARVTPLAAPRPAAA